MTVALYISPKSIISPIIVTDTLVTDLRGNTLGKIATRYRDFCIGNHTFQNSLARKYIITSRGAVVASAGSVQDIEDFIEYIDLVIGDASENRPLKNLALRASEYGLGKVNAIAAYPNSVVNKLHKMKPDHAIEWEDDLIGYFCAIGSGADDICERVRGLCDQFRDTTEHKHINTDVEMAHLVANFVQNNNLIDEVYSSSPSSTGYNRTWGGPIEIIYYDPYDNKWAQDRSYAHFIYQKVLDTKLSANLIDRTFMFDPGSISGWFQAVRRSKESYYNLTYRLPSLRADIQKIEFFDWENWTPEIVKLSIVTGVDDNGFFRKTGVRHHGYRLDEKNGISKHLGATGVSFLPFGDELETFLATYG